MKKTKEANENKVEKGKEQKEREKAQSQDWEGQFGRRIFGNEGERQNYGG